MFVEGALFHFRFVTHVLLFEKISMAGLIYDQGLHDRCNNDVHWLAHLIASLEERHQLTLRLAKEQIGELSREVDAQRGTNERLRMQNMDLLERNQGLSRQGGVLLQLQREIMSGCEGRGSSLEERRIN